MFQIHDANSNNAYFLSILTTNAVTNATNSTPDSVDHVFSSAWYAVGHVCGSARDATPHVFSPVH